MFIPRLPFLFALWGVFALPTTEAQVAYTWEDSNGVIHFSDTPIQGAKALTLPDLEASAPAPKVESTERLTLPANSTIQSKKKTKPNTELPQSLTLTMLTPQHDQTIRSNRGLIAVEVEGNRKLGVGEQLQLILDGNAYGAPQNGFTWQLRNINRGTHTLAVQAKRSGKLIASTSPITVHLHRASVKPTIKGAD